MSKRASMAHGAAALAVLFAAVLTPRSAAAQPDPFQDYERWKTGEAEPSQAGSPKAVSQEEAIGPWTGFNQGTWSVGGRIQLSYTGTDNEVIEGVAESNNTYFFRLTPSVSWVPVDRLQVALSMGVFSKSVAQEQGQDADETNFITEASAHYAFPLGQRFSFIPGLGLGFYVGSGSRDLLISQNGNQTMVEESTSTAGFTAAVYLGVGYALTEHWQIRSGLSLNAMIGSEGIDSSGASLSNSTAHIGLPLELYYSF